MPRISTDVSRAVKAWIHERARKEARSEAYIIRRILEDAASHDVPSTTIKKES